MKNHERFARLFAGYTARYGRYDITGAPGPEEKVAGRAKTVDGELKLADYKSHVEGKIGIGVIPLREDDRVNFAAIDVDVYKADDQKKRKLTHEDVAIAFKDTPLIVSYSKSGGIHVWLFSEEGVSAKLAVAYLEVKAAEIGVAGCEIFPKQTERYSQEDVGNWINLPYFGETRQALVPWRPNDDRETPYTFNKKSLSEFLDIAEHTAKIVTDAWLEAHTESEGSRAAKTELWIDGPPCLQTLIAGRDTAAERQKIEAACGRGDINEQQKEKKLAYLRPQLDDNRNIAFFNVGLYLRRRQFEMSPDGEVSEKDRAALIDQLKEVHTTWKVKSGNDGIDREIDLIARQAFKGKWGYKCSEEPLKSHCNRRLCLKRRFGVGSGANDVLAVKGFTIVLSDPPQYYMTVNESRVYISDPETLHSQNAFAVAVMGQIHKPWTMMADPKYKEMLAGLFETADVIKPPPESDRRSILLSSLRDFIDSKGKEKGKNDAAIFNGAVLITQDETEAWFSLRHFLTFIKSRGHSWEDRTMVRILVDDFGVLPHRTTTVAGKSLRPYVVNLERLRQLEDAEGET